ncbi:histone-lysine N-methyltransferase KMT5C-like [Nasonia vitripennis]|uniref:SET domain-containing protein n=1 Tax=Nasonia vitripennis TaxID=7425 RepID=A0A7M7H4M4_NASVI|nr:histone-lysine N-methyltransferase KMT5C-like [Nasonia vitripennis]
MSEEHSTFQMMTLMDDIAKALIIDPYLNVKVSKVGLIMDVEDIICCPTSNFMSTTLKQFTETLNYDKTVQTLLTCLNDQIFSIIYEEYLRSHMVWYLKVLDSSNGFLVTKTSQYKGQENQVKIVASKAVSKNTKVDVLYGNYVKISPQEETLLKKLNSDFSIMYSLMYKCSTILLGTIAFINHDCNENSAYYSLKANKVKIITTKNIEIGDEVTVRYSNDFFGPNNESYDGSLTKKEQRQVSDKRDNAGLAYNNNLYGNLINFLKKSKKFDLENIEAIDPSDITICEIANKIYKEKHKKNNLALLNFMTKYKTSILNDVKNDTTDIIAPEKKNTELYETKLIEVSILHCHEDFFNCIFKCKPLDLKFFSSEPALASRVRLGIDCRTIAERFCQGNDF